MILPTPRLFVLSNTSSNPLLPLGTSKSIQFVHAWNRRGAFVILGSSSRRTKIGRSIFSILYNFFNPKFYVDQWLAYTNRIQSNVTNWFSALSHFANAFTYENHTTTEERNSVGIWESSNCTFIDGAYHLVVLNVAVSSFPQHPRKKEEKPVGDPKRRQRGKKKLHKIQLTDCECSVLNFVDRPHQPNSNKLLQDLNVFNRMQYTHTHTKHTDL